MYKTPRPAFCGAGLFFKRSFVRTFLSLPLILLCLVPLNGEASGPALTYQSKVQEARLGRHPEWLNLLHYKSSLLSSSGYVSYVDDDRFFFSNNGKRDPDSELLETLAAFYKTDKAGGSHAQCRFPARLAWLQKQSGIKLQNLPEVVCKEYDDWKKMVKAKQATLIFPAYYLNSPSSMFGHTLLRLDASDEESDSKWLSYAVNFGADIRNEDNSILFAFKGLAGGYSGLFSVMPYFKKIQEYNTIENRDLWEYRLNLSEQEVDRMVTHLWELKEIRFDYYFFDENCSYRLLELLEVARPGVELTDEFIVTAIPVDTVRSVIDSGLTDKVEYRPSQAVVLRDRLKKIPQDSKQLVISISADPELVYADNFTSLPERQQRNIIDASYKYLRFLQTRQTRDQQSARNSYRLLELINTYPNDGPDKVTTPVQPDKGHHTKRFSLGGGQRYGQNYAEVSLRMAFHSLEDSDNGFLRGAQINMFNLQVRADEKNNLQLKQLDIVDIFSLTPRNDFFKPLSWRVYTGLERQFVDGRDRTAAHVSGGAGVSYALTDAGLVYALGTGRIEYNSAFNNGIDVALGATMGGLYHSELGVSKFDLSGLGFANGEERMKLAVTQGIVLSRNHALQISFQREWLQQATINETGIRYHYYYD